jgi:hypothetical protein
MGGRMMGMYTELHFNTELVNNLPENVVKILKYMMGLKKQDDFDIPDHPFFKTDRWKRMALHDSYSFPADTHSTLRFDDISDAYMLCIRCNLKNYDEEIEKFLHWIQEYLPEWYEKGECLGYYRYEENLEPTVINIDFMESLRISKKVD